MGKIKAASVGTRLTAHFACSLVSGLVMCKLKEYDVYDTKCPYWDHAFLNNTKLKLVEIIDTDK